MDNTWGTPYFFKPIKFGFDMSIVAATKYYSGHSDVMGGSLAVNKKVLEVLYPIKKNTQRYKLWKKYYSGASGLLGLKIKSKNKKSVIKFINSLKLFSYGYSWGGFESLALYQDIREQGNRKFLKLQKDEHLVRLHIGLEDPKDLIQDLKRSLRLVK